MITGSRLRNRRWPLITSAVLVISWLAYSFLWNPVVHHKTGWVQPADIWGTYRAAHYIGWGDVGDIYTRGTGFITFPGVLLVLAPLAILTDHLGLSESYPRAMAHPSAWPILGPVSILIGLLPLFAFDALAEHLGVTHRVRIVLCWCQMILLWPVLVIWGHPEDAIAIGFAVYGLIAAWKKQWVKGGWLFAAALLFQPLVVLFFPIVLAIYPDARRRIRWVVQAVLPSAVLLAIPIIGSWNETTYALVKQPTFPSVNHPTPLLFLAPVIGRFRPSTGVAYVHVGTLHEFLSGTLMTGGNIVAPGLGRLAALAVAVLVGLWVWSRRPSENVTLWLCALVLGVWCVLEPVMTPYYAWPFLALVVLSAGLNSPGRLAVTFGAALFITLWTEHFFRPWVWWGPTVLAVGLALYCARPVPVSKAQETRPEAARL